MELQAVTGQLYIIEGVGQETTAVSAETAVPGLLAQPAPGRAARGRDRDHLFVHFTLTGQPDETAALSRELLTIISRRFYQTSGSVTAALRQGIIDANQLLLRRNLSKNQPAREGAITCAVLRQDELYTLQAGESLAMIGRAFGIERLPPQHPDHVTPLGRTSGLDIRFYHHRLQIGDTFLLADPRIAHLPTTAFEDALIDTPIEDGLDALRRVVGSDSARLMLVEFTGEIPPGLPDAVRAPTLPTSQPVATVPQPRRDPRQTPAVPASERRPQPVRPAAGSSVRLPEIPKVSVDVETGARRATSQAAMGLSRFTGWLAEVLERLQKPTGENDEPIAIMVVPTLLAVIIPILMAAIVTGVYLQWGQVQRLAAVKEGMRLNLGLAEQTDDEAEARNYYDTVLALATEAETELRPGDPEVGQLRREARTALDLLDGITRLQGDTLYTYTEGSALTAVALQDDPAVNLFTLDSGNGYVYLHQLSADDPFAAAEPQRLFFNGQAIGAHVVGQIVDLMWRNQGSAVPREGVALLDNNGALLTYHPDLGDTTTAPLGLASEWQMPTAITTYNERLYVLDTGAAAIWKYFPSGAQFDVKADERTLALSEDAQLAQVVDFGIYSEDGSLLLAYGDGRLRYYDTRADRRLWDEETMLREGGLTTPPDQITAVHIVGRGLNTSLFVADTGNGRILQLNRGGRVLAQFKATGPDGDEIFAAIDDFAVAENPLRIYAVAGERLYVATQP